jgi:TolB-like protein/Flp pilus assembly protein TadD
MKRCPQCNRVETDEALKFCRLDGTPLVANVASESESATKALPASRPTEETTTGRLHVTPSIAVLPFVNMSPDPENEYFCDGLAEELLNALAKIENLRVAARTSSFSFKGKNVNVDEIGRTLHVNSVLEGGVRKSGNRVRITVQLVNASDGYNLWSERYDREMEDIFEVQDEITLAVVDALKLKLLHAEKEEVLKRHTEDSAAYQAYLKGRFHWYKRSADGLNRSVDYFKEALEIDPGYALAYIGLADSYDVLGFYTMLAPKQAFPWAKAAAMKALEIDPSLSEALASIGYVQLYFEWNWPAAEASFQQVIMLKPDYAIAHGYYGNFLTLMARFEEGMAEFRRAIELDPLSLIANAALGWCYHFARQYDQSIKQLRKTIELDHNFEVAHFWLGSAYAENQMFSEAISELETALALSGRRAGISASLGYVYGLIGEKAKALQVVADLTVMSKEKYVSPYRIANIHTALGDKDAAFDWLERAYEDRSHLLVFLNIDPRIDSLRDDPRFTDLARRVGLPQ